MEVVGVLFVLVVVLFGSAIIFNDAVQKPIEKISYDDTH